MPRGVPASGKRRPRFTPAVESATVPVAPDLGPDGDDEPTYDEVQGVQPAAAELSPEQLEIKRLRDLLAQKQGSEDVEPIVEEPFQVPDDGEVIRIHFLEDGMTALGKVFYRGDELEFVAGSAAHRDTYDRRGRTWLDMRSDDFAQVERYGKVMFRNGPWPGKSYADGTFETLRSEAGDSFVNAPSAAELERAEKARKRRAAPRLPAQV